MKKNIVLYRNNLDIFHRKDHLEVLKWDIKNMAESLNIEYRFSMNKDCAADPLTTIYESKEDLWFLQKTPNGDSLFPDGVQKFSAIFLFNNSSYWVWEYLYDLENVWTVCYWVDSVHDYHYDKTSVPAILTSEASSSATMGYAYIITENGVSMTPPVFNENGGVIKDFRGKFLIYLTYLEDFSGKKELGVITTTINEMQTYGKIYFYTPTLITERITGVDNTTEEIYLRTEDTRAKYDIVTLVPLTDNGGRWAPYLYKKVFGVWNLYGHIIIKNSQSTFSLFAGEHFCLLKE